MIVLVIVTHEHRSWVSSNWVLLWVTLLIVAVLVMGVGLALRRR